MVISDFSDILDRYAFSRINTLIASDARQDGTVIAVTADRQSDKERLK